MAEAPEQAASVHAGEPASGAFTEHVPSIVPFVPTPGGERESSYRPLSLLAIAGFCLAVIYSASVALGGLFVFASRKPLLFKLLLVMAPVAAVLAATMRRIREPAKIAAFAGLVLAGVLTAVSLLSLVAFSSSQPWLLPWAMYLLVVVAIVVCCIARTRIAASEDTLSGADLAKWGLGLSLFFGINYGAYDAATAWAVRGQARQAADGFLADLQKRDTMGAFLKTMPAVARPAEGISSTELRDTIEVKFNSTGGGRPQGMYSAFCQSELLRLLENSGEESKIEPGSVEPKFEGGAYKVLFQYRLDTPYGVFPAWVMAVGLDDKDSGRRLWHIDLNGTRLGDPYGDTTHGMEMGRRTIAARAFSGEWTDQLRRGALMDAYLATVDSTRRPEQRRAALLTAPGLLAVAGLGTQAEAKAGKAGQDLEKGLAAFRKGAIIDTEGGGNPTDRFWASSAPVKEGGIEVKTADGKDIHWREKILSRLEEVFNGTLRVTLGVSLVPPDRVRIPITKVVGDKRLVSVNCTMKFEKQTGGPDFQVEAIIFVEMPAGKEMSSAKELRIHSLQLLRGGSIADMMDPRQQRRPGRP